MFGCGGWFLDFMFHGVSFNDYFQYKFYNLSHSEKKTYITCRRHKKILKLSNNPQFVNVFYSKEKFNETFNRWIKRDWLDVNIATDDELDNFIKNHDCFFVKYKQGCEGRGVNKIQAKDITTVNDFRLRYGNCIAEEQLYNVDEIAEFNYSSLNTIRITTCRDVKSGEIRIMSCILRIGAGGSLDNMHQGGVCVAVDMKTGMLDDKGVDITGHEYAKHPLSEKHFKGFVIPQWQEVMACINDIVQICPEVGYTGWDIAVCKDKGVVVIEGNHNGHHDIQQLPIGKGLWNEYKEVLNI